MLVYVYVTQESFFYAIKSSSKYGYWFTFALFSYFLVYIVSLRICRLLRNKINEDIVLVVISVFIYLLSIIALKFEFVSPENDLLGISRLVHYPFFVFGSRVRKYYMEFCKLLDNQYFSMLVVAMFVLILIFPIPNVINKFGTVGFFTGGILGIIVTLATFRKYKEALSTSHNIGRIVQFVGRRTLDIYLIHYFFIASNMQALLPNFDRLESPFLEFICDIAISIIIIALCLLVSSVLRTSPLLAQWLFGVKK